MNNDFHRTFITAEFAKVEHEIRLGGPAGEYFGEVTESGESFGIKAGYWINETLALSGGYVDFGSMDVSDFYSEGTIDGFFVEAPQEISATAFTASAIFSSRPFVNPWRFYGELGLFMWDYEWTADFIFDGEKLGTEDVAKDNGFGIWGGFGAGFDITNQLELQLAAQWYVLEVDFEEYGEILFEESGTDIQITRLVVSLSYQF